LISIYLEGLADKVVRTAKLTLKRSAAFYSVDDTASNVPSALTSVWRLIEPFKFVDPTLISIQDIGAVPNNGGQTSLASYDAGTHIVTLDIAIAV